MKYSGYMGGLLAALLASGAFVSTSEARDRASVGYRYDPKADVSGEGRDGTLTSERLDLRIGYPVLRDRTRIVVPSLQASWERLDFTGDPQPDVDLYGVGISLMGRMRTHERDTWMAMLSPGLYTDFESINGDDFRLFGMLIAIREFSDTFSAGFGIVYNQDFGEPRVYPALGFNWQATETLELDMNMPRPRVIYTPMADWRFTAYATPGGGDWSIVRDGEDRELVLENFRVGVSAERALGHGLWAVVETGANLSRSYELKTPDGPTLVDLELEDSAYMRIAVAFR